MAPVPEESFTERVNDCRTSYRSYPDWLQYSLVADPSTDAGRSVLVLHAIRQILPHTSSVHDVPLGAILEENDRTGTKANLELFLWNSGVGWNYKNRIEFQGVFWGLMLSIVVGVIRMVLDFTFLAPACGSDEVDTRPEIISKVDFLHFATILALFATIAMVVISLFTQQRPESKVVIFIELIPMTVPIPIPMTNQ